MKNQLCVKASPDFFFPPFPQPQQHLAKHQNRPIIVIRQVNITPTTRAIKKLLDPCVQSIHCLRSASVMVS